MKSVYIHIPFCSSICTYCDFCKMYYDKTLVSKYLKVLAHEIKNTYKGEPIKTIYIGGGTPSALDIEELESLFDILEIFKKDKLQEYTIECNVENIDKEKLLLFKEKGVNRLSIGIQTFNNKLLNILGRHHDDDLVVRTIRDAKEIGFDNISVDLIYGVNGQTMDDLKEDVSKFSKLGIPHVSLYSLIIEPHTKLYISSFKEQDEDLNALMYEYINKTLNDNHYHHYEISNYAKEGYESKHNLVYWHNEEYYGFGIAASSFIGHKRYDNTRNLSRYLEGDLISNEEILNERKMMENEMILGLRLTRGVNKKHFYDKYHKRIEDVFSIEDLIVKKMLIDDGTYLYIPDDKLFLSNLVLIAFLE